MHFNNTSILKTVYFESILIHLQQYIYKTFKLSLRVQFIHNQSKRVTFTCMDNAVNSMSFIWNDNMREKREANANAT